MVRSIAEEERVSRSRIITAAILPVIAVVVLWIVHLIDLVFDLDLNRNGIVPRTVSGLKGILFMPFLHSPQEFSSHLINNSTSLLFLGWAVMYFYPRLSGKVVLSTWILGGLLVWLTARPSYHIGASGIIYGLAGFLFTSGVLRRQRTLMALSMLIVFLHGGMVWGVLPVMPNLSWEGHLWGMFSGIVVAVLYRHVPPAVSDPKPIHFDDEDDDDQEVMTTDPADQQMDGLPIRRDPPASPGPWQSSDSWTQGNTPRS